MAMLIDGGPDVKTYLARLENGEIEWPRISPCCSKPFHRHGGYQRAVSDGETDCRIPINRRRCSGCRKTHALLPAFLEPRRIFTLTVVQQAAEHYAAGASLRAVAREGSGQVIGEPPYQRVWHWLRQLEAQVQGIQVFIVALLSRLDPSGQALLVGDDRAVTAAASDDRRARLGRFFAWLRRAAAALGRLGVWEGVPTGGLLAAARWLAHRTAFALAAAQPT